MNTSATERPADYKDDLSVTLTPDALVFAFMAGKLVLDEQGRLPANALPLEVVYPLGTYQGRNVLAGTLEGVPDGWNIHPVRATFDLLSEDSFGLAGFAHQVVEFQRTHRYCGACATELQDATANSGLGRYRKCPQCGLSVYPRVAPAVIVLVSRGHGQDTEFLLARSPGYTPGMYSTLAGFVEPSESLESTVHREILEEVGVQVQNVEYRFSQPWPFPHSLMLAFNAQYRSGEITLQADEIVDAGWFSINHLPPLPAPFTSSRRLIEEALAQLRS